MNNQEENVSKVEDLVIAAKFPPVTSTSGLVFAKRILNNKKPVDVVQGKFNGFLDYDFNELLEEYIDNRIVIDIDPYSDTVKTADKFRIDGMKLIEKLNKDYKNILSRSFPAINNFLSFEYKMKHPEINWIAEFSDPLMIDLENKVRGKGNRYRYQDDEFIDLINSKIDELNQNEDFCNDFNQNNFVLDKIKKGDNYFFIAEYIVYLFADKIIFTNENQREIMLSYFPHFIKEMVMEKSEIKVHPTLDDEYYHIKETDYELDNECINLAYFGTYLAKRNFETIYYALESLDDKVKHRVKLHFFLSEDDCTYIKKITANLNVSNDIILNNKVSLLEFLNISTKLDVLIVNDALTKGIFDVNPFLPSKVSDYLGSGNDVWAICEENSVLESLDEIRYKSYVDDYLSAKETLNSIIKDKLNFDCKSISIEEEFFIQNNFLKSRVNYLNQIIPKNPNAKVKQKDKEIKKLKKQNKKLKKQNKEILNSKSWKLTKILRKPKNLLKK